MVDMGYVGIELRISGYIRGFEIIFCCSSVNLYCLLLNLGHVRILLLSPLTEVSVIGPHISSHQEKMQRNHRLPPLPLNPEER